MTVAGVLSGGDTRLGQGLAITAGGSANIQNVTIAQDLTATGGDVAFECGSVGGDVTIAHEALGRFSVLDGAAFCTTG